MPLLFALFFLVKQQTIRHEMKERLERELLHTIAVPQDKVVWAKYNKEIIVEGKMFDVESYSIKDSVCVFTGLFDEEETALNDLLEKKTNDKNENELLAQLFQWLQSPCISLSFHEEVAVNKNNETCFPVLHHISFPYINIPTPPPQA
jgi:hypothetical protein